MSRFQTSFLVLAVVVVVLLLGQAANTGDLPVSYEMAKRLGAGMSLFAADDYVCDDCNVLLISIDTLRQDHVGAYGYERNTTPNVDRFAQDSVRFDTAIAQAPSTLPSHASIFTSMIPEHHRAFHALSQGIPDEAITMAEILWDAGFRTLAVTAGAQMHRKYNLDQGFDEWFNYEGDMTHTSRFSDTVEKGIEYLEEYGDEQFFMLLHTYEVHSPYTPPPEYLREFDPDYDGPLGDEISLDYLKSVFQNPVRLRVSEEDRERIVAAYDGEIRNMDDALGELIAYLKERDLYDDTLIIFTSDHGEEFGERGRMGWHSWTLYEELLRVPLIVKFPHDRYAGRTVAEIAQGIDLLPTLVDVLGIDVDLPFEGSSLMDRLLDRRHRAVFAVSQRDVSEPALPTSIRTARWKLYDGALYDLAADPMERFDVSADYPLVKAAMDVNMALIRELRALEDGQRVELDQELRDQLRALGYIQ